MLSVRPCSMPQREEKMHVPDLVQWLLDQALGSPREDRYRHDRRTSSGGRNTVGSFALGLPDQAGPTQDGYALSHPAGTVRA